MSIHESRQAVTIPMPVLEVHSLTKSYAERPILRGVSFNLHQGDGYPPRIRQQVTHVPLNDDPQFQEIFAEEMGFPLR